MAILIKGPISYEIDENNPFLCFECGEQFPTSHKLNLHSSTHTIVDDVYNSMNIQKEDHGYYKCPQCILVFGKINDVEEHLMSRHNMDCFLQSSIRKTIEESIKGTFSSFLPVIPASQIIIQKPSPIRVSVVQSLATNTDNEFADQSVPRNKQIQLPVIRGLSAATLQRIPAPNKDKSKPGVAVKPAVLAVPPSTSNFPCNVLCFQCGRGYDNANDLKNHSCQDGSVKKHTYNCSVCKQGFFNSTELQIHEDSHSKILRPYKCGLCDLNFSTGSNLENHILSHRETEKSNVEIPRMSPPKFDEALTYMDTEDPKPEGTFVCGKCKLKFCSIETLIAHQKALKHYITQNIIRDPLDISNVSAANQIPQPAKVVATPIEENEESSEDEILLIFRCNKCGVNFGSEKFLKDHQCTALEKNIKNEAAKKTKKTFKCKECDDIFDEKKLLQNHIENEHPEEDEESQVEEEEEVEGSTKRRSLRSSRATTYGCSICKKTFLTQVQADSHIANIHYHCGICNQKFDDNNEQEDHISKYHSKHLIGYCKICNKYFKTAENLLQHNERCHSKEKDRYCRLCDMSFIVAASKETHDSFFHGDTPYNPVKTGHVQCEVCGRDISFMSNLRSHYNSHDKTGPSPVPQEIEPVPIAFQCQKCSESFENANLLELHNVLHETEKARKISPKKQLHLSDEIPEDKSKSKKFKKTDELENDIKEETFKCKQCKKKCRSQKHLEKHTRKVHGKPLNIPVDLRCNDCGKVLQTETGFKLHMQYHERTKREQGTETSICKVCKKVFMSKTAFESHSKSHEKTSASPEKRSASPEKHTDKKRGKFECVLCKEIFKSFELLNTHKKTNHSSDFYCFICNIDCATKNKLKQHFKTNHKGEKMHFETDDEDKEHPEEEENSDSVTNTKCEYCDKDDIDNLAIHLKTIHNIINNDIILHETKNKPIPVLDSLICALCFKTYQMKYNLRRHLKDNHGVSNSAKSDEILKLWIEPINCELCNTETSKFKSEGEFATHLKWDHKIKNEESLNTLVERKSLEAKDDGCCKFCNKVYYNYQNFSDHTRVVHKVINLEFRHVFCKVNNESLKDICEDSVESTATTPESPVAKVVSKKENSVVKNGILCKLCDSNKEVVELSSHFDTYHKISIKDIVEKIANDTFVVGPAVEMTCCLCAKKSFLTMAHMRRHLKESHFIKNEVERKKFELMWKEKSKPSFKCENCDECFPTESTLRRHKSSHDIENKYDCKNCGANFDSVHGLLRHEKRCGKDIFSCTMCAKKFSFTKDFNAHLKTHKTSITPQPETPLNNSSIIMNETNITDTSNLEPESILPDDGLPEETAPEPMDMDIDFDIKATKVIPSKQVDKENNETEMLEESQKTTKTVPDSITQNLDFKPLDSLLLDAVSEPKTPQKVVDNSKECM